MDVVSRSGDVPPPPALPPQVPAGPCSAPPQMTRLMGTWAEILFLQLEFYIRLVVPSADKFRCKLLASGCRGLSGGWMLFFPRISRCSRLGSFCKWAIFIYTLKMRWEKIGRVRFHIDFSSGNRCELHPSEEESFAVVWEIWRFQAIVLRSKLVKFRNLYTYAENFKHE